MSFFLLLLSPLTLPLSLISPEKILLNGFSYGFLIALFIYHLLQWLLSKEIIWGYCSLWIITVLSINGLYHANSAEWLIGFFFLLLGGTTHLLVKQNHAFDKGQKGWRYFSHQHQRKFLKYWMVFVGIGGVLMIAFFLKRRMMGDIDSWLLDVGMVTLVLLQGLFVNREIQSKKEGVVLGFKRQIDPKGISAGSAIKTPQEDFDHSVSVAPFRVYQILIITDNIEIKEKISNKIKLLSFHIKTLPQDPSAISYLELCSQTAQVIDLVLMPVKLPGTLELEMLQSIFSKKIIEDTPFLFINDPNPLMDLLFRVSKNEVDLESPAAILLIEKIGDTLLLMIDHQQVHQLKHHSAQTGRVENFDQIWTLAQRELAQDPIPNSAIVFRDSQKKEQNFIPYFFKKIPEAVLKTLYVKEDSSILVFNHVEEEHPIYQFFLESIRQLGLVAHHPNPYIQTFANRRIIGSHLLYLQPHWLTPAVICLFRTHKQDPFSETDVHYWKTLLERTELLRNLKDPLILEPRLVAALVQIQSKRATLLYVTGKIGYCELHFEGADQSPEMVRIDFDLLVRYLTPHCLIRVHHSYLLNPNKIKMVKKINKNQDFEIILQNTNERISVGVPYLSEILSYFPL